MIESKNCRCAGAVRKNRGLLPRASRRAPEADKDVRAPDSLMCSTKRNMGIRLGRDELKKALEEGEP
jgi:hypothetical protein